jgi:hypothetical protein
MFSLGGSDVGGRTMCIDDSPLSLSSFVMLKEHALDAAIEVKRITKFTKLQ